MMILFRVSYSETEDPKVTRILSSRDATPVSLTLESSSLKWCLAPGKYARCVHIVLRVPQIVSIILITKLRVIKHIVARSVSS